jgi:hypothetical protein
MQQAVLQTPRIQVVDGRIVGVPWQRWLEGALATDEDNTVRTRLLRIDRRSTPARWPRPILPTDKQSKGGFYDPSRADHISQHARFDRDRSADPRGSGQAGDLL